jgi:non-specific serine/threonine protein kinase
MLETIRELGLERLRESGEEEGTRRRHAAWFLGLAERAESELFGPEQRVWLDRLDLELDNLRSALEWLRERGDPISGLRLAQALCWFWIKRVHLTTGREAIERALAATAATPSAVRVNALLTAGSLAVLQGDMATAVARHDAALSDARALSERRLEAMAMTSLGGALLNTDPRAGADWLEQALSLHQAADDGFGEALTHVQLGIAALAAGDGKRAVTHGDAAVATFRSVGDWWFTVYALAILGSVWLARGEPGRSRQAFVESAALARRHGERWLMHQPLVGLALVASAEGMPERAVRLLAASEAAAVTVGGANPAPYRALIDHALEDAQARLGPAAFNAAWALGQSLTLGEAVDDALETGDELAPNPAVGADADPAPRLTAREQEVLRLVVEGHSDKEIAAALFVSPRTATTHVTSILAKLGVTSRTAAAAIAVRRGLA